MNLDKHNPSRIGKSESIKKEEDLGHVDSLADLQKIIEKNGDNKDENTTKENGQKKPVLKGIPEIPKDNIKIKKLKKTTKQENIKKNQEKSQKLKEFKKEATSISSTPDIKNKNHLESKNSNKEKENLYQIRQEAHKMLDRASDTYYEFEKNEEKAWYEDQDWNKKLQEAREMENNEIVAEIKIVKEKILNQKLEPLLKNIANYEFLDTTFTNEKGEIELVANKEYIKKDYAKSIFFLASYLTPQEIWELIRTEKGASREDHLDREFYTISDKDLEGKFGDEILKIKKRDENKNLTEEEITLRNLITLGQKRIVQAISAEHQSRLYMKANNISNISQKVGEIIYHDFPKIEIVDKKGEKKETVNQIPFDMAFVVARGYYGADSFATYDKENGKISLISSPEVVNQIYAEIKEIIPDFPAPVGAKLLTPDDPEIIKQIREKISKEKWQEILGVMKLKKIKPETLENTPPSEIEQKTANINTDEGAEDEESLVREEYKEPSGIIGSGRDQMSEEEFSDFINNESKPKNKKERKKANKKKKTEETLEQKTTFEPELDDKKIQTLAEKISSGEKLSPEDEAIKEKIGDILNALLNKENSINSEKENEVNLKNDIIEQIEKTEEKPDKKQEVIVNLLKRKEEIERRLQEIEDEKFGVNTYKKKKNWLQKTWRKIFNF